MNKTETKIYELLKNNELYSNKKGIYTIYPQQFLIAKSGKSERTVRGALKCLEEHGFIIRERLPEENLMLFYLPKEDFSERHIHNRFKNAPSSTVSGNENCPSSTVSGNENCPSSTVSGNENCPSSTFSVKASKYLYFLQNKETNALGHTSKRSFNNMNYVTNSIEHDNIEIKILRPEKFSISKWDVNTHKVWEMSLHKLVDVLPRGKMATVEMIDRKRTIKITVKEFAKKCNIPERFARDYLNEAGKALYEMSVRCEIDDPEQQVKRGRRKKAPEQAKKYKLHRVVAGITEDQNGYTVINGVLELTFDIDFAKYLSQHSRALPRHENIFRINSNNHRHSYYIANKLQEHYFMNIGKANSNRISVRCLKEELPDLPTYDEVMRADGDRHVEKRIIKPFERDITALVDEYDILESWHYCTKNGDNLSDEQLQNYDYSEWSEWLIEFHLKEYPQQTEMMRLAEHSEKQKRAAKAKKDKN